MRESVGRSNFCFERVSIKKVGVGRWLEEKTLDLFHVSPIQSYHVHLLSENAVD